MQKFRLPKFPIAVGLIALLAASLPYLIAARAGGGEFVFGGFLLNPLDGNTYLAKMYQGAAGSWQFTLPYTAEPGAGAYLFLFYLALGRLARLLSLPNLVVFHLARLSGAAFLLWTLWRYFGALFPAPRPRKTAFALAALGSGMGWLLLATGALTSDFWVAEAYPFLSSFANPHFPLGLGLMLWLLMPPLDAPLSRGRMAALAGISLILSLLSPFGVVIVSLILGAEFLLHLWGQTAPRRLFARLMVAALPALPVMLYDLWVVRTHPVLAAWDAQNLTPSPPLWDTLISLSPALLLALVAAWRLLRPRGAEHTSEAARLPGGRPLLLWVGISLLMSYLPLGLQRRFMMGIYIPLSGLAALGLEFLARNRPRRYRWLLAATFTLALLTNLIVLASGLFAASTHDLQVYLTRDEWNALAWLEAHTPPDSLVLAAPQTGLLIPAHTGRRVLYGHPYETVNAEAMQAAARAFFDGSLTATEMQAFLRQHGVDVLFYGPRERALGNVAPPEGWQARFQSGEVTLFGPADKP